MTTRKKPAAKVKANAIAAPLLVPIGVVKKVDEAPPTPPAIPAGTRGLVSKELIVLPQAYILLGSGSYGNVFGYGEGKQSIAVKYTKGELDAALRADLLVEMCVLTSLKHPNIVGIIDAFMTPTYMALVQPRAGETLSSYIKQKKVEGTGIPLEDAKIILLQLIKGMRYLHSMDILHGDYKPSNTLVYDDPQCKLRVVIADFGLAKANQCFKYNTSGNNVFSVWWRAPELTLGGKYTIAADTWALGIMAVEMLTGKVPFPHSKDDELLTYIFVRLGLPDETSWPGVTALPRWKPAAYVIELEEINKTSKASGNPTEYVLQAGGMLSKFGITVGGARVGLPKEEMDIILSMLVLNPEQRISLEELEKNPWFDSVRERLDVECLRTDKLGSSACDVAITRRISREKIGTIDQQLEATFNMRNILYDWLFEASSEFKLPDHTLALALYMVGRYGAVKQYVRVELQLLGMAALHTASLLMDYFSIKAVDLMYISENAFTVEQLADMERNLLYTIGIDLIVATPYDLAAVYSQSYGEDTKNRVSSLLNLSYFTEVHSRCDPKMVALFCIIMAVYISKEPFKQKQVLLEEYTRAQVSECIAKYHRELATTLSYRAQVRDAILLNTQRGKEKVNVILAHLPAFIESFVPFASREAVMRVLGHLTPDTEVGKLTLQLSGVHV